MNPTWRPGWPAAPSRSCGKLHEELSGQKISVILTDADGLVLARLTGGPRPGACSWTAIKLAPGFSYAEDRVGTNGIGTALEAGGPAHVFGHEHYAESLERFGCAGVPIHDPVSGKTVGVIDLTCWRKDADPLMISLVKATAEQITQALVDGPQRPGRRPAPGVRPGLPPDRRHRAGPRQRRSHAERPRPARSSIRVTRPR